MKIPKSKKQESGIRTFWNCFAFFLLCAAALLLYGTWPRESVEATVVHPSEEDESVDWDDRQLYDSEGSTQVVNWTVVTNYITADEFADNFDTMPDDDLAKVLDAIKVVENRAGDPEAVGDIHLTHKAYGLYQIRQPYLDDVNRIVGPDAMMEIWGKPELTVEDVKNEDVARWIARIYLTHYGKSYAKKTGKKPTKEVYARMHNGGPNGWERASTNTYLVKVMKELK